MTRNLNFFLWLCFLVIFTFCNNQDKQANEIAKKYLDHLNKYEFEEAKKLGTTATVEMLEQIESLMSLSNIDGERMSDEEIEIKSCEIEKDTAYCKFEVEGQVQDLKLVYLKNKWWVHAGEGIPVIE